MERERVRERVRERERGGERESEGGRKSVCFGKNVYQCRKGSWWEVEFPPRMLMWKD
jgi:hypothetical protein